MGRETTRKRRFGRLAGVAAALVLSGVGAWLLSGDRVIESRLVIGGLLGFEMDSTPDDVPPPELISPAGRVVPFNQVDELGYTLPLDVKRPRPAGPNPVAPPERGAGGPRGASGASGDRGERAAFARVGGGFEEHRLGPDDGHTQNETSIAVDGSVLIAGWNAYTGSSLVMGLGRSTDGGHTWTSSNFGGHNVTSDPAVRAGGAGRWYYAYLASGGQFGGSDVDIFVRRSTDDGATWANPVDASQNGGFDDKPYIDARGLEVLVGWADFSFSPAKVRTVRSTDGGVSFGANHILANNSVGGNGACPVIQPDGDYFVFWRDSFQDSLWVSRSTNQGANWSADRGIVEMTPLPSTLPGGFRIVNLPSADADPSSGDLLVVWNDQAFGNADVLSIRSTDDGLTWSTPVRVNDDVGPTAQFFPWVTFDEVGVAHCMWYDRREDGFKIDAYYARSFDGGATWEPNVRVTTAAFTPVLPWDTTVQFIGDYNGIAAGGGVAYPFFQDSREGEQDVYVALVPGSAVDVAPDTGGPRGAPGARPSLVAAPNPFRDGTRVTLRGMAAGVGAGAGVDASASAGARSGGDLVVLDAGGREVRRAASSGGGGDDGWWWDGRDDADRELPAGVYYVAADGPGAVDARGAALRVVKVR